MIGNYLSDIIADDGQIAHVQITIICTSDLEQFIQCSFVITESKQFLEMVVIIYMCIAGEKMIRKESK